MQKNEWSSKEPPPPIEVVLWNLNDNIDEKFLRKHCEVYGEITRIKVYRHNVTNKHLQFGKVIYEKLNFVFVFSLFRKHINI